MATAPQKFPALDGFLAGNFADADLAGLSDEQAAVAQLRRATLDWHRQVLREGRAALRAPHLNWRHIADCANRAFTGEKQARAWLSRMMRELERGIERV
jgi:hypothetical protein